VLTIIVEIFQSIFSAFIYTPFMSPQEGERLLEEYHGEKEQMEKEAGEGGRDKEATSKGSCGIMQEDKNGNTSKCTAMMYQSPSFEDASNQKLLSPAPAVEKGGENEFVSVSHLASVQVKAVPTLSILKNKPEPRSVSRRCLPRRSEDAVILSSRGSAKKLRKGSNHKKYIGDDDDYSPYGEETPDNDESSVGNLVEEIEKSPYVPGRCAEDREPIFEEMKALLLKDDDSSQIVQMFGPTNAVCLVKANALVEKSGMLYSQNWTRGSIRGNTVGIIPNHLLLMVLVPNRFVKASELLLSGLCRDLKVYDSVNRGLDDWGWNEDYELVRATKKNYKFKANKRDCFKCAVFVARAHSCFLAFGRRELKPRLTNKLKACLDMMEAHLVAPSSNGRNVHAASNGTSATSPSTSSLTTNVKKRKKIIPDHVLSISSLVSSSSFALCSTASPSAITQNSNLHHDSAAKRKRGRPPKNSKCLPIQQRSSSILSPPLKQPEFVENGNNEEQKESISSKSKHHHLQSSKLRGESRADDAATSLTLRRISPSSSVPSLYKLMSRFEDQYKEMGQRYADMGVILTQMKTAMEEKREQSEQEIRRELLDEIQNNILESMPKR